MQSEHTYADYIDDAGIAQIQALEKKTGFHQEP